MNAQAAFEKFHAANPHIYRLFQMFAFQAIEAGRKRLSAQLIAERIRWECAVLTRTDDGFKLNNNFRPFYARLFMADHPHLGEVFETRAQKRGL